MRRSQRRINKQIIGKVLPYVNFVVAVSALTFQMTVLYPWHIQLDDDFVKLKHDQVENLTEFHHLKVQKLNEIEQALVDVKSQLREQQQAKNSAHHK